MQIFSIFAAPHKSAGKNSKKKSKVASQKHVCKGSSKDSKGKKHLTVVAPGAKRSASAKHQGKIFFQ